MIVPKDFFIEFYQKTEKFQSFYSDESLPNDLLYEDIWKKIIKKPKKILCFTRLSWDTSIWYGKMKDALEKDKQNPAVIFCAGQEFDRKIFEELIKTYPRKIFVINSHGFSDSTYYDISMCHHAWKGYIGNVPFVPHNERPYTISALSNRFEVFKCLFIAKLLTCKINSCVTFHNHDNVSRQSFLDLCQQVLAMTPNKDVLYKIDELLKSAPIRPEFMTEPLNKRFDAHNEGVLYNLWQQIDLSMHVKSRLNLTLEGSYIDHGKGVNFTEKTGKCLASGTFPLHIGQSGGFKRLHNWGFKGFENNNKFNLDYDELQPDFLSANFRSKKVEKIFKMLESLNDNTDVEDMCRENYEWFHNGWYDHCEKQNEIEIDRLIDNL